MSALAMSGGMAASGRYAASRAARRGAKGGFAGGVPWRVPIVRARAERAIFAPVASSRSKASVRSRRGRVSDVATRAVEPEAVTADDDDLLFGLPKRDVGEPLAILLASQFVLFIGVGALLPALPLYAQNIGLSGSANGIVLSAPALAMLLLNLPAGKLVDSWGRKQMMMAGMAVIALSDLATSQCRTVAALILARLALGAGRAAAENGDRAYLADLTDRFPTARGTMSGSQQAIQALGLVIGPLIGGRAVEAFGAPTVFLLISGAAFACTGGYSLLPDINVAAEREEERIALSMDMSVEEEEEMERELEAIKAASDWRVLLESDRQRVITAAAAANALGFVAKLTCIPWFATQALDATPAQVGELFSVTALLGMVSAPLSGIVADKIGLKAVVVASLAMCAAGLVVAQDSSDFHELQLCIGLWGMGTAAAGPAVNALAQESAPKGGEGEALTLPKTAGDLVFLIGPVFLGGFDDVLGSAGASLDIVAGSAAAAAAYALVSLKPMGEEDGDE